MTAIKRYKVIIEDRLLEGKIYLYANSIVLIKEIIDMLEKEKENDA